MSAADGLRDRLREQTAAAHLALETALDLLGGQAAPAPMRRLLGRFHGFHVAWEPAVARVLGDPGCTGPRTKLALLRDDLLRLGMTAAAIDALPVCSRAADLAGDAAGAWGSLYVLEGSTLGGKFITRHLRTLPWWPAGGLQYFDPYGTLTAQRWHDTVARIDTIPPHAHDAVIGAANRTFELLQEWLVPPNDDLHA